MVTRYLATITVSCTLVLGQDAFLEQITGDAVPTPDMDRIEYYSDHPILLDSASVDEIADLPFISRSMARRIRTLLKSPNPPRTLDNLCNQLGCSDEQRLVLERCTRLGSSGLLSGATIHLRSRTMYWVTPPRASVDGRFRGIPHEQYFRVTTNAGRMSITALTNKDAGEPIVADFISGSLRTSIGNGIVIVGDYYTELGLGLVLWRPFGARKGTDVITPCTELGRGIKQYRSAMEYRFFRGIAAEQSIPIGDSVSVTIRAGLSALPRSGTIDSISRSITSLSTDGYNRTPSELAKRHVITERSGIASAEYHSSSLTIGSALFALDYPYPITSSSTLVMPAKRGVFATFYAYYQWEQTIGAWELSRDYGGNIASRIGIEHRAERTAIALGGRWCAPYFRAPFGYNFGEAAQPTNEAGIYGGIRSWLGRSVLLLAYADFYSHIATIGNLPRLRRGIDAFGEVRIRADQQTQVIVRIRQEHRTDDRSTKQGIVADEVLRSTIRCELQYGNGHGLTSRIRIEGIQRTSTEAPNIKTEYGIAAFGEFSIPLSEQITIGARWTYYQTDSFASAVYTFEQLAPGLLVSAPLYGNGSRSFAFVRWRFWERFSLWIRYGSMERQDVPSIGSGVTEIPGPRDTRAYLQLDMAF